MRSLLVLSAFLAFVFSEKLVDCENRYADCALGCSQMICDEGDRHCMKKLDKCSSVCVKKLLKCQHRFGGDECGCNGAITCEIGTVCCNYNCGICTEPDGVCTEQACLCSSPEPNDLTFEDVPSTTGIKDKRRRRKGDKGNKGGHGNGRGTDDFPGMERSTHEPRDGKGSNSKDGPDFDYMPSSTHKPRNGNNGNNGRDSSDEKVPSSTDTDFDDMSSSTNKPRRGDRNGRNGGRRLRRLVESAKNIFSN